MNATRTLRKVLACFERDLTIARSYRGAFIYELAETLFGVATYYYLSRFVQSAELSRALPTGGDYFAFALVGVAFYDYMTVSFDLFEDSLQQARQNGTLEALLVTETSLATQLAGSCIYPFALLAMRTLVYILWGVLLFDFPIAEANWGGALLVLAVSIASFAALGVLSAAHLLLFKKGTPVRWAFLGVSGLVSGMIYPVSVLPDWLQTVARFIPVTWSLEAMRGALLEGAPLAALWPALQILLLFAVILLPLALGAFSWALRRTRITGTLTHF
jgi:ABC-2 type transport system permease protein